MLNKNKVRLMTRLALYEEGRGRRDRRTDNYFKTDYISRQLLITFLSWTLCFVLFVGVYMVYELEMLMLEVYTLDLKELLTPFVGWYLAGLAVMLLITLVVYWRRFDRSYKALGQYDRALQRLLAAYGGKDRAHK